MRRLGTKSLPVRSGCAPGRATRGVANPRAAVEVGEETFEVTAGVAEGEERERLWTLQKEEYPGFADYEEKTDRQIPVVILEPVAGA